MTFQWYSVFIHLLTKTFINWYLIRRFKDCFRIAIQSTIACCYLTLSNCIFYDIVNGKWSEWSDWGQCSVSCGGGTQSRSRSCTPPKNGGKGCEGDNSQTQECETDPCPGKEHIMPTSWNINRPMLVWALWEGCQQIQSMGTRKRSTQNVALF